MKNPDPIHTHFHIRGIELFVFLGWPSEEHSEKQVVLLDIEITLASPPLACTTDDLADTICYADLITDIQQAIRTPVFRLIEHLSHEIYTLIKSRLPPHSALSVRVTKHPKISGLTGGVVFSYGDKQ